MNQGRLGDEGSPVPAIILAALVGMAVFIPVFVLLRGKGKTTDQAFDAAAKTSISVVSTMFMVLIFAALPAIAILAACSYFFGFEWNFWHFLVAEFVLAGVFALFIAGK